MQIKPANPTKLLHQIITGRYSRTGASNQEQDGAGYTDTSDRNVREIIRDKYRTFMNWDYRDSLRRSCRKSGEKEVRSISLCNNGSTVAIDLSALMGGVLNAGRAKAIRLDRRISDSNSHKQLKKPSKHDNKPSEIAHLPSNPAPKPLPQFHLSPEMQAVRQQRRERFKKYSNPLQYLRHYIEKQHYAPTPEQQHLIEKTVAIQKSLEHEPGTPMDLPQLEALLQQIYKLMNLAVDYNQLLYLALVTCLAADICYFLKEYPRACYFYNQTRIAGSYSRMDKLKIPALMGLARVCFDLAKFDQAKRLFRKALQYAWRVGDEGTELEVYDCYGLIFNQEGRMKQSLFYHEKYASNKLEPANSALRKISNDMLKDYDMHIESLQDSNLDTLFLQYVHLPISKAYQTKSRVPSDKKYRNYKEGQSPRMEKEYYDFSAQSFLDADTQIEKLLSEDYEFKTEIPDPDKPGSRQLNRLNVRRRQSESPYGMGGTKKQIDFEHSIEYNRIIGKKQVKPNLQKELKFPLDRQVEQKLKEKVEPAWYEIMVKDIKKKRMEKVGNLKEKVRNSHLSYHKYPNQRKKSAMWSLEKINQSFNRTILDWIDPLK